MKHLSILVTSMIVTGSLGMPLTGMADEMDDLEVFIDIVENLDGMESDFASMRGPEESDEDSDADFGDHGLEDEFREDDEIDDEFDDRDEFEDEESEDGFEHDEDFDREELDEEDDFEHEEGEDVETDEFDEEPHEEDELDEATGEMTDELVEEEPGTGEDAV